jgi:tetratricopeptide (TPR) repeat protein
MDASYHIQRAELLMERRRYDAALKELTEALKIEPESFSAKQEICWCLIKQNKFDEAETWANQLISANPEGYIGYYYKATCAGCLGKISPAHTYINQAISCAPYWSDLYAYKAELYLVEEDWGRAEKYARQGLERNPDNIQCLQKLNAALTKQRSKKKLDESIRLVLEKNPDDADTHLSVGWSLLETSRAREALTHFETALQQNPEEEMAREGLLEAVKAKNFLYRWLLRLDFYVAAESLQFRRGFMLFSFIFIISIGVNLTENYSPYWLFLLIPAAFVLQTMWLVKWVISVLLCLTRKKYRHFMPAAKITLKGFEEHGFSLAFVILCIGVVTTVPVVIKYCVMLFLCVFINAFIWRNYFHKKVGAGNPKTIRDFSLLLTVLFTLPLICLVADGRDLWTVIMFIFGFFYLATADRIYAWKMFD